MHDPLHQQRFTHILEQYAGRLDDLLEAARGFKSQALPAELLDEIAATVGELMLVLSDHLAVAQTQALADSIISHARQLRSNLRLQELPGEQVGVAVCRLSEEVNRMIREDKRAA